MSTSYFLLSKSPERDVANNESNTIFTNQNQTVYLLPKNLMNCYINDGLFESRLIDWCRQFCSKDKVFLDIGAHTGTYTLSLAQHCKNVYSFEPQKMTYYALCGGVALSNLRNVTCCQVGLGSAEQVGPMTLKIVSNDGGGSTVQSKSNLPVLNEEEIQIYTMDHFQIEDVGFIKMDVEDNELFVLKGARETLRKSGNPPILFECNGENQELFDFIQNELGYKIVRVAGANNMYLACT